MTLDELLRLLDSTPAIVDIQPASLCYLPADVTVLPFSSEMAWLLDTPRTTLPHRFLIQEESKGYAGRFPQVVCDHDPISPALNNILDERFEELLVRITKQSDLPEVVVAAAPDFDLIILFLVDGLSFEDVKHWPTQLGANSALLPCLVDVPTITSVAFPNLLGRPTLAERLFNQGYHFRQGFSYWTREDNQLTDRLFRAISDVSKVGHFRHILSELDQNLKEEIQSKKYIQIMRTGLDGYAHSQKRRPPLKAIVEDILNELEQLIELVTAKCLRFNWRASIFLTSDHGILWLHEHDFVVVGTAPSNSSARWSDWRNLYHHQERGRKFVVDEKEYYCLNYPKLRRPPRINEQGVHGGISYEESVVPFLSVRVEG